MDTRSSYFAHSANDVGRLHLLKEHLASVGRIAGEFASAFPWKSEAELAGLLHDLGKYGDLFQARLRGEESGLDHWSSGALEALVTHKAIAAALAIEGHHIGLQAASEIRQRFEQTRQGRSPFGREIRLSDVDTERLVERLRADGLAPTRQGPVCVPANQVPVDGAIARMLDVRMLFSCLVDADFLDTEAHFQGNLEGKQPRAAGPTLDPALAMQRLDAFMKDSVFRRNESETTVAQVRAALWQSASESAHSPTGVFTLTAPTGSGKTLAMLKFALAHAQQNALSRIVLVVPFLSIIEQTAAIYRSVFADQPIHFLLEHHSLAGLGPEQTQSDAEGTSRDESERQRRLLAQNWDAPIVVTTNVQLLESMFSNRPSACRKLHRLHDAVILFDEAQTLPPDLAVPTLAALSHLSVASHSSVVFATATQPAFETLHDAVRKHAVSGWAPTEIVSDHRGMFRRLKRVEVEWPAPDEALDWPTLSATLRHDATPQVLCIVNLKRHALALLKEMDGVEGVFHLSTNLCAAHRRAVLRTVRERLASNDRQPCRVVSTQCVEAGVDLDFPLVYRAMGPLDAIAQAAGRCNREGRLNASGRLGRTRVYQPILDATNPRHMFPTHAYWQATEVTASLLRANNGSLDITDPEVFHRYYRELYNLRDLPNQKQELSEVITAMHFPETARLYRLIEQDAIQVVVPWWARLDEYEALREQAMRGITGEWIARAQGLSVNLYRPKAGQPAWGSLVPARLRRGGASDEWFVLEDPNRADPEQRMYDDVLGLRLPAGQQVMIA